MQETKYVLNKASGTLHRLPASESCNTDQIEWRVEFEAGSDFMAMARAIQRRVNLKPSRLCTRCFKP